MKKIIKDCVCATLKDRLLQDLLDNPYVILFDGSSDVYGGKYIAIFARYISFEEDAIMTKLLGVVELGSAQTGEVLYQLLFDEIFSVNPNLKKNLIGASTDN